MSKFTIQAFRLDRLPALLIAVGMEVSLPYDYGTARFRIPRTTETPSPLMKSC
jgi:hypothetical protein